MKKYIVYIVTLLVFMASSAGFSQAPQGIKYQAIARDAMGTVLTNTDVVFIISIIQGSADGITVYNETHNTATNKAGLVTLTIGQGETGNDFSLIDWSNGPYFMTVEINGIIMGSSQLLSVPYAIYAREAENVFGGDYNSLTNKPDLSGYITDESDPLFNASVASGITSSDTARWNLEYSGTEPAVKYDAGSGIDITDNVISTSIPDPDLPVPVKFQGSVIYVHPFFIRSGTWGLNNLLTGATSDDDGLANTEKIVAVNGEGTYAAKACYDLNDLGYDDWYLPSRVEMDAVYKQSYLLKYLSYSSHYWNSTEMNKDNGWKVNFYNGAHTTDFKTQVNTFVCIRRD
ncbi:MAG: DUF1566 domain-containing protein [Bacteroidales bacterium]|nr:MAG: DUF1566 domain-containing protein [Bacteroidales bacterium]